MKNLLAAFVAFVLTANSIAQPKSSTSNVFNCDEIKFWTDHLINNFENFTFLPNSDESTFLSSERIPNEYESCFFSPASQMSESRMFKATKEFKTEKEVNVFFKKISTQIEECFKDQKIEMDKESNDVNMFYIDYSSSGGNIVFELDKEPLYEMNGDAFTDKIIGYHTRIKMEFQVRTNEEMIEVEDQNANFDFKEVSFWEEAVRDFDIFGNFTIDYVGEAMYSKRIPTNFDFCILKNNVYNGDQLITAYKNFESLEDAKGWFSEFNNEISNCLTSKDFKADDFYIDPDNPEHQRANYVKKFNEKGQETQISLEIMQRYDLESYAKLDGYFLIFTLEFINGEF